MKIGYIVRENIKKHVEEKNRMPKKKHRHSNICGGKVYKINAWIRGKPAYQCERCGASYYTPVKCCVRDLNDHS